MQLFDKSELETGEESPINQDNRVTNQVTDDSMKTKFIQFKRVCASFANSNFLILWSGQYFPN